MIIRQLKKEDIEVISNAFKQQCWNKPASLYEMYLKENQSGKRYTLVAFIGDEFAGYGNILFDSHYEEFSKQSIPEVVDLNTLIKFRGQGVATKLMDSLEEKIKETSDTVGIGVGLIKDYGNAQRLYVKRGYVPNGMGIYYGNRQIGYFDEIKADDDLVLYLTKKVA